MKALNAKIKRLKALLTKSGTISKEKDVEIAQLRRKEEEAASLDDKWTAFRVLMRVEDVQNSSGLPRYVTAQDQAYDIWCLVVNESNGTSSGKEGTAIKTCQSKWILESQMSTYMQAEELSLMGEVPESTLQQEQSQELKEVEEGHRAHVSTLRAEIATVTQNFQAYKVCCVCWEKTTEHCIHFLISL